MMKLSICTFNIEGLTLLYNYQQNPDLHSYIYSKAIILKNYLQTLNVDIICIQEYISVFHLELDNYDQIEIDSNIIFFRKSYTYIEHTVHPLIGIIIKLQLGSDFHGLQIYVGTNRLAPLAGGSSKRIETMNAVDSFAKDKLFIYCADTNLRKNENPTLHNIFDSILTGDITNGFYTLDKKFNPYFAGDLDSTNRARYDRIYHTDHLNCKGLYVHRTKNYPTLKHMIYPFGGLSDHYPVEAEFEL